LRAYVVDSDTFSLKAKNDFYKSLRFVYYDGEMPAIPPSIAAEQAIARQNIALSVVKQANEQSEKLVEILDDAARTAPVNTTRGSNTDIFA
jgi:hypothetical protein